MDQDEKHKLGYQGALQMVAVEHHTIWATFQSLLAANAVLLTLVGVLIKIFPQYKWAPQILAVAGLFICVAWFFALTRQFSYHRYWHAWARAIEQKTLNPEVRMFQLGRVFGEGASVELPTGDSMRMTWAGRAFKVQWLASSLIIVIALVYAILFWMALS